MVGDSLISSDSLTFLITYQGSISNINLPAHYNEPPDPSRQYLVSMPFESSRLRFIMLTMVHSYPIFLRWILRAIRLMIPNHEYFDQFRDTLDFLLDHPRRSYTTLFPSAHTWWLLLSVIVLNGIDWIAFEVLNVSCLITQLYFYHPTEIQQ